MEPFANNLDGKLKEIIREKGACKSLAILSIFCPTAVVWSIAAYEIWNTQNLHLSPRMGRNTRNTQTDLYHAKLCTMHGFRQTFWKSITID